MIPNFVGSSVLSEQINSERDYKRRVRVMDELLDSIGANESHRLMPLLDLASKEVENHENINHALPDAAPAPILAYLMEEHDLKPTWLKSWVDKVSSPPS